MGGLPPEVVALGTSLGQWFAAALGRVPTRAEIAAACTELAAMPQPCSDDDVLQATDRIAGRLNVSNPVRDGRLGWLLAMTSMEGS